MPKDICLADSLPGEHFHKKINCLSTRIQRELVKSSAQFKETLEKLGDDKIIFNKNERDPNIAFLPITVSRYTFKNVHMFKYLGLLVTEKKRTLAIPPY